MTNRQLFTIGGLTIAAGGLALFYGASRMPYYTSIGPGPGFFPFWLSLLLTVLGLLAAFGAWREPVRDLPADFWPQEGGIWRLLAILAALAMAALGLETIGFPITMLAVNLLVLITLGLRKPLPLITVALAGSFGVYFVFSHWLKVTLPAGSFPI
ncbi:tripartite tricarboxylate transporter TctB family protein [Devosia sp. YIM 151766]|uniref:tripartite tricarboxylate transporter TctB family protein n=1 Tax=Devosia sp. YIM 151766 TaxID=3017325 RepID=UPI00255CD1D0|nr:tripartite tricarboxylate transporter TctB family protein [Devosia sp. YIM 151766]WIY52731.1 tripartite tricarboxylate transporter TctB family protein [Devosia sp. YIM 151766]